MIVLLRGMHLVSFAVLSMAAGCVAFPNDLGSAPLFSQCRVPNPTEGDAPPSACERAWDTVTPIYPPASEDRDALCALRFPHARPSERDCPRGAISIVDIGDVLIFEGQSGAENPGAFVHTYRIAHDGRRGRLVYVRSTFLADPLAAELFTAPTAPLPDWLTGRPIRVGRDTFVLEDRVVRLERGILRVTARLELEPEATVTTVLPAPHSFGANGYEWDGYVAIETDPFVLRRLENDGRTRFTFTDDAPISERPYYGVAAADTDGNIAVLASQHRTASSVIVLDAGSGKARRRTLPAMNNEAHMRIHDGQLLVAGSTYDQLEEAASGGLVVANRFAGRRSVVMRLDVASLCPRSLHFFEPSGDVGGDLQVLHVNEDGTMVYGMSEDTAPLPPALVYADASGRLCDSVSLYDVAVDGPQHLTDLLDIDIGFLVADGHGVWLATER